MARTSHDSRTPGLKITREGSDGGSHVVTDGWGHPVGRIECAVFPDVWHVLRQHGSGERHVATYSTLADARLDVRAGLLD